MARFYTHPFNSPLLRTLLITFLLMFVAGIGSYAQTVASFTPTFGPVGTEVTITGTGFTQAHTVSIGAGATYDFTIVSDTEIKVKVPTSTSNGAVRVSSNQGAGIGAGNYTVVNAPVINSIAPTSGPVGTEVTITGSNFSTTTSVVIGSGSTTNFTIGSGGTEIKVIVPASASNGNFRLNSNQGSSNSSSNYTLTNAPVISNFNPSSGPVGTEVTITGTNFSTVTSISIGSGTVTNFTKVSDTELKVTVPSSASNGAIRVNSNQGSGSSSGSYTLVNAPVITSFTPSSGPVGTEITITGTNFTGASQVNVGAGSVLASAFISATNTEIKIRVPSNASTGRVEIVSNAGLAIKGTFTVTGAPVITSFTPTSGPVGTEVIIKGANFTGATQVYVGAGRGNFTFISDTEIRVIVPTSASTGGVQVRTPQGLINSSNPFTLTGAPSITSFTPSSGPVGTEIIITGSDLSRATQVNIGAGPVLASSFMYQSNTEIKLVVPSNASTGKVQIVSNDGHAFKGTYTVTPPYLSTTTSELTFNKAAVGNSQTTEYSLSGLGLKNGESVTVALSESSPFTISTNAGSGFSKSITVTGVANNRLNPVSIYVKYTSVEGDNVPDVINHAQGTITKSLNVRVVTPLPVELTAFTANLKNGQVNLNWSTASEKDNSHFEIEKASGSSSNFRKIDTVKSKVGTSSTATQYTFSTYYNSNGATEYYRLKQVDLDGGTKYSKVVSVKPSGIVKQLEVAPNPISEDSKIYFTAETDGKAIVRVTSVTGKQVYFEQIDVHGGENAVQLSKYNKLMPSVYIVTVEHSGKRESVRIEKK